MEELLRENQIPFQTCGKYKVVDVRDLDAWVSRDTQKQVSSEAFLPKELFTIPEVASKMSTTVFAVRELCRSGELKYVPIGHAWLISPRAIQEFIRRKELC